MTFYVTVAAASPAGCYIGIYSQSGTQLAVSSDFSSTLGTNTGAITVPISYSMSANTVYYIAFLFGNSTTTSPTLYALNSAGAFLNIGTTQSSGTFAGGGRVLTGATSSTTLPSPFSGSPAQATRLYWLGIK